MTAEEHSALHYQDNDGFNPAAGSIGRWGEDAVSDEVIEKYGGGA